MDLNTEQAKWMSHKEYCEKHHYKNSDTIIWYCPKCESISNYRYNFCHFCGKKLNGVDEVRNIF